MANTGLPATVTILGLGSGTLSSVAVFPASQTVAGVATTLGFPLANIASAILTGTNPGILGVPNGGTNTSTLTQNGIIFGNGSATIGITAAGATSIPLLGQGANNAPAFAVLPVIGGGTNTTILTQNGILFGNGSSTLGITGAGNTALVLISPGPLQNPIFGQVSMTAAVTGVLSVANGGTQTSTLTQNGVLYGNAANTVGITAAGATSVPFLGQGAGNAPAFGVLPVIGGGTNTTTLTNEGILYGQGTSTIGITAAGAAGLPLIGNGTVVAPAFAVLSVSGGGTGTSTLTAHGVLIGEGTSTVAILAAATANFILTGVSTTADPAFTGTPSIATSLAVGTTNLPGVGNIYAQGFYNSVAGFSRVTANYSTVSTTFANVTGLSAAVVTAGTYSFEAVLFATAGATGGTKVQIACTAGASNVIYDGVSYAAGALINQARSTALLAAVATATTATTPTFRVIGNLTTITTGALTVQIAQVAATTTSTVILGGSFMQVFQMN
jgi:hypothetical protein